MTSGVNRIFVRKWINRLETNQFETVSILDCLSELKLEITQQTKSKEDEQQIVFLLEKIISNAKLDWLSSAYSRASVFEILTNLNPESTLIFLTGLLNEFSAGSRLDFVIGLLEQYFLSGSYQLLILQQSHVSHQISQLTWNNIITCISSLPDHVANKFESRASFPLFHHENFFLFIGLQVVQILEKFVENIQEHKDIDTTFLSNNIGQFCLRGKTDFLFKPVYPALVKKTRNCFLWQRISQKLFCKLSDRSLDTILLHIFKNAPTSFCLSRILGDIVIENSKAKFIILHKLLLTYSSSDCTVACNVVAYLASSKATFSLLFQVLIKLLKVWSSPSAIKHTPYEQHRYVTAAILTCTARVKEAFDERYRDDITSAFMEGVKNHLESPDEKIRVIGMIVAEMVSDLVKNPGQKEKLQFDYNKSDDVKFLLSLSSVESEPEDEFYDQQSLIYENIKSLMSDLSSKSSLETSYTVDKISFVKMAKTQLINLQPVDGEKEPNTVTGNAVTEAEEIDSDDDLAPFDLPNEKPFSKISKPMYIRDCMEGLIANTDREHMEIYLNCVVELIEKDSFAAKEVAVELCKVLLNLQDNYAIDGFHLLRRRSVVSSLVCDPKAVASYLTEEFYGENYNLQQRMDMLDILVMAAGKLSGLQKQAKTNQNLNVEDERNRDTALPWQEIVENRIESKTRRFGKIRKVQETSPDRFGPVAGYFFYPLMAGYDRRIRTLDLLGTDSMILGRLLYSLGTIIYSAANSTVVEDMALALLEFVTQLRHHAEAFVRKACVYCITMTTLSVRSLTERLNDVALDSREWLCDVIEHDDDTQARQLASNCLLLMSSKVRDELGGNG